VEMFREELCNAAQICGSRPPQDQHLHVRIDKPSLIGAEQPVAGCVELGQITIGPFGSLQKFPLENTRAMYNNFICLVQVQKARSDERVENIASAMCMSMAKKANGITLKAPHSVIEKLQNAVSKGPCFAVFIRKLRKLDFMMTGPISALQKIATDTPELPGDSVAHGGFIAGNREQKLELFPKASDMDAWLQDRKKNSGTDNRYLDLAKFNPMQQRALALTGCTKSGVVLVQGPPGTGKSHLIAHGILPLLVEEKTKGVLVVCNSNCAVDSIAEKAIQDDCTIRDQVVRVGYKGKVSASVVKGGFYEENLDVALNSPKNVVFTTLHNASGQSGDLFVDRFDILVIDEAAQVEDLKIFVLLCRLMKSVKKIVCVGDHKQLQPYVSEGLRSQGYGMSTMERLIETYREYTEAAEKTPGGTSDARTIHVMLEEQHRMPVDVRKIVSQLYYAGKLRDAPNINALRGGSVVSLRGSTSAVRNKLPSIIALDLKFGEAEWNPFQRSSENKTEAEATRAVYDFFFQNYAKDEGAKLTEADICILSPFNRHKNRLRTVIAGVDEADWSKYENLGVEDSAEGIDLEPSQLTKIRNIDTVDKFQGSEREVVMINTVVEKCNGDRAGDPHFINVAMSRCKGLLVLIGSLSKIAEGDEGWRAILKYCKETGQKLLECGKMEDVMAGLTVYLEPAGKMQRVK